MKGRIVSNICAIFNPVPLNSGSNTHLCLGSRTSAVLALPFEVHTWQYILNGPFSHIFMVVTAEL
jgi:hypothetical protein